MRASAYAIFWFCSLLACQTQSLWNQLKVFQKIRMYSLLLTCRVVCIFVCVCVYYDVDMLTRPSRASPKLSRRGNTSSMSPSKIIVNSEPVYMHVWYINVHLSNGKSLSERLLPVCVCACRLETESEGARKWESRRETVIPAPDGRDVRGGRAMSLKKKTPNSEFSPHLLRF